MTNTNTTQEGQTPRTDKACFEADGSELVTCVTSDFARQLERELAAQAETIAGLTREVAEANAQQPINTHRRLFDLVRNCRAQLHEEDLITDGEYAWLCQHTFSDDPKQGSPSPRRLEDYDDLRAQLTEARRDGERIGWLDSQCSAYGFEGVHEGNNWQIGGPFSSIRQAIDAAQHRNAGEGRK